jgi:hypothetical protein
MAVLLSTRGGRVLASESNPFVPLVVGGVLAFVALALWSRRDDASPAEGMRKRDEQRADAEAAFVHLFETCTDFAQIAAANRVEFFSHISEIPQDWGIRWCYSNSYTQCFVALEDDGRAAYLLTQSTPLLFLNADQVLGAEIIEDGQITTTVSKDNAVARAIVGGVLALHSAHR